MIFYQRENSQSRENNDIRVFDNFSFMSHIHRDPELTLVLEGSCEITVEEVTYTLRTGDMALIFSNQIHAYASPAPSRILIHVFSADNVRSFQRALDGRIGKTPLFPCDETVRQFYKTCLLEKKYRSPLALKACLYAVLDRYLETVELVEAPRVSEDILHKMLHYISLHFREDISLSSMAESLGYEAHYLSRVFSSAVHINLRRYINQYRIDYAKHRLLESEDSITDIALSSGFQSIRNFNRAFWENEQLTPQDFRSR